MTYGAPVFKKGEPQGGTTEAMKRDIQRAKWRKQKQRQRAVAKMRAKQGH